MLAGWACGLLAVVAAAQTPQALQSKAPQAKQAKSQKVEKPYTGPRLLHVIPPHPPAQPSPSQAPTPPRHIPLVVPAGTPLRVELLKKVHIGKLNEPVEAELIESVYAFDKQVIPKGTKVTGKVIRILPPTKLHRTEALMDGNFSPLKRARLEFSSLTLPDGRQIHVETRVSRGIPNVIRLVTQPGKKKKGLIGQAKQTMEQEWKNAVGQVTKPGRLHRLKEFVVSQLPYHPEYLEKGTVFDAQLREPLSFGREAVPPGALAHFGDPPPANSIVEARLLTPLSSATAHKGTPMEAVVTRPLFSAKKQLLLPQGTRLDGVVVQVRPARRLDRNGLLRFAIRRMVLPSGLTSRVDASIAGLEVSQNSGIALGPEGGAHIPNTKRRFLDTALSLAVAATSMAGDSDHHMGTANTATGGGDASTNALGGGSGFGLVGFVLGIAAHSQVVGAAFGAYGAARSVYAHFIARGHNVILARGTPMIIAFGTQNPTGH
jgi:hypothetical protein